MASRRGLTAAALTVAAALCALLLVAPSAPAQTSSSVTKAWNDALRKAAQNFQRQVSRPAPTTPAPAPAPAPSPAPAPAPAPTPAPAPAPADTTTLTDAKPGDTVALAAGTTLVIGDIARSGGTTTVQDSTLQIGDVVVGTGVDGQATGATLAITDGAFAAPKTLTDQGFEVAPGDPLVYALSSSGPGTQVSGELVSTGETASPEALRAATATEEAVASALPPAPGGKSFRFGLKLNGDGSTTVRAFLGADEVVYGRIRLNGSYEFQLKLPIEINETKVVVEGTLKGSNILNPSSITEIGGALDITVGTKARLTGSLRITGDTLALQGRLTVACPISGDIGGEVATELPLRSSNRDWSVAIAGGAGPDGCGMTKDFGLGPNSGAGGSLKSVGGRLEIDLQADATINTTLIPTKTSFSVGFALNVTPGAYRVSASGSTQGAGFSADIQSNGSYALAFNLDDLELGGVSLGAKGSIRRTAPSAAVEYSISGGLTGKAKIWDNLYFLGGSLGIDSTGGLTFSGTIRQLCNAGYIDASASGRIASAKDFKFDAKGLASKCRIGDGALFDGTAFYATIESQNGKILYDAGLGIAQLNLIKAPILIIGDVSTWLTGVQGSLSNTCDGCYERGVTQLKFQARAHAALQTVSQLTKTVNQVVGWIPFVGALIKPVTQVVNNVTTTCTAATAFGTVEVKGLVVKKITLGIRNPQFGLLTLPVQAALTARLELDLEKAFTSSGGSGVLGQLPAVQLPPLGSGGPVPGWGC